MPFATPHSTAATSDSRASVRPARTHAPLSRTLAQRFGSRARAHRAALPADAPAATKRTTDAAATRTDAGAPDPIVAPELVRSLLVRFQRESLPRLAMLWSYYRNPLEPSSPIPAAGGVASRGYRLAQEHGLPSRILGSLHTRGAAARLVDDRAWSRKEVVIENDIAWRVNTMVDFMFGRPVRIASTAADPALRARIESLLSRVLERSGGAAFMQDIGLLGHVYGHVDLIVRVEPDDSTSNDSTGTPNDGMPSGEPPTPRAAADDPPIVRPPSGETGGTGPVTGSTTDDADASPIAADRAVSRIWIQAVDPTRGVGLPGAGSGAPMDVYIHRFQHPTRELEPAGLTDASPTRRWLLQSWWRMSGGASGNEQTVPRVETFVEVFADGRRQVFRAEGERLGAMIESASALVDVRPDDGAPVVRIQNIPMPGSSDGLSEVEPLIPLQDELNTRLSDRASRVTFASFKMILARNIDNAESLPVGPGQVWSTHNDDASIEMFGGDASSPSEEHHIQQVREAMDKLSAVPPVAGGVVQAKIGNLSSENALRITLMGLLSKTARKRLSYGRGLAQVCELVLEAMDRLGVLKTDPADRTVRIDWTDSLQRDELTSLTIAEKKLALGVPKDRVLAELGYGPGDPGVV